MVHSPGRPPPVPPPTRENTNANILDASTNTATGDTVVNARITAERSSPFAPLVPSSVAQKLNDVDQGAEPAAGPKLQSSQTQIIKAKGEDVAQEHEEMRREQESPDRQTRSAPPGFGSNSLHILTNVQKYALS